MTRIWMNLLLWHTLIFLLFKQGFCQNYKLVSVLFRHGDRTPDPSTLYPLDPHINETYYPFGLGHLTNKGKQRLFVLGKFLRKRYNSFLGNNYHPDVVEASRTKYNRTEESLLSVLAGLFSHFQPQQISYNRSLVKEDMSLCYSYEYCPKYKKLLDQYMKTEPVIQFLKRNQKLLEYLEQKSGVKDLKGPVELWGLYSCLYSQEEWGLSLPEWAKDLYPKVIEKLTVDFMKLHIATTKMKQLTGGFLLKKIIDNMQNKSKNTLVPKTRKLYLYSAHDINILYMSGVLDQLIMQSIPYGSFYIIELVETSGIDVVQIFSSNCDMQEITLNRITIPGCNFACPIDKFVEVLTKYIPHNNACWNET